MAKNRKFNWWWLVGGIVCIAGIIIAVLANNNVEDHTANKITGSIAVDNSDLKVNWERYQTIDANLNESINITESGTYHLTGTLEDGSITIDAGVSEVRLILDNVSISNSTGPAIVCYNAENLVIELVGENTLTDGAEYNEYDADVDGVIYSKADLAFTGSGTLNVNGNYADGIVGKDDVVIRGGIYHLDTTDDGIRGKDSVYVTAGTFTIKSGGDAIKSTNDTDFGKGFVLVETGDFDIVAVGKGLKATNSLLIYDGNFSLETTDDAVHTNNYVGITGGTFNIQSSDDGMHADHELIIDGGTINITKSYEGVEAQVITINNGTLSVIATDDGVNAGGGADNSSQNRAGANGFKSDANCTLTFNGGNTYVNSGGDGVDSNGYLTFNGGTVTVDGPTNNGNGALDAGLGITIQGGTVIAVGASGMAESLGTNSGVPNISVFFAAAQSAGTVVEVRDSAGSTVLSHTSAKSFNHMAAGSDKLVPGETYTIYLNGTEYQSFTISEVTTVIGNSNANSNNMMQRRQR